MNPFQELIFLYKFCRKQLGLGKLRSIAASLRGDLRIFVNGAVGSTQGTYPINCGGTSVYYSDDISFRYASSMGIFILANSPSSGTCNLKIQVQQSYTKPAVVGTSDSNWVIGDGVPDIYTNLNDSLAHIKTVSVVPMPKARLVITGLGSNASDVTLLAVLFIQELIA